MLRFLKEVRVEMGKVTWLTGGEVMRRFVQVLGLVVFILGYFWVLDFTLKVLTK